MSDRVPKYEPLNMVTHSIRAAQIVSQYGVGGFVDFPDQTLMTAAPENWGNVKKIHDERLEKLLNVEYFGMPTLVTYTRFPEWYFCPKCRYIKPIQDWADEFKRKNKVKSERDPYMIRNIKCPTCSIDLVASSIVTVCEDGHIDDFPWVKWAHAKNMYGSKPICSENPTMKFPPGNSAVQGLEGMIIECETCGAKATLRGAFGDEETFKELDEKTHYNYRFKCTGRHPWKNVTEVCNCYPRTMQRGGTTVYFSKIESSLVIPPFSSKLTSKIEETNDFEECRASISTIMSLDILDETQKLQTVIEKIDKYADAIAVKLGENKKQVEEILKRKFLNNEGEGEGTKDIEYRTEEYEALNGEMNVQSDDDGDFKREEISIEKYNIPFVSKISLIHKIREVIALTGYSRIRPADASEDNKTPVTVVTIKEQNTKWYPAHEVRGEGIFIEFDSNEINNWRNKNLDLEKRVKILNDNYANSYRGKNSEKIISGKYLLLHTLSHLLIKQLSFECGYNIASLKERIYCSEEIEGKEMSGIFIYTADGDSEGSMGGLVRQGRPDTFPKIFRRAIESAVACSNDPVCNLSMGQGRDSLNLAACHSCALLPETSCEMFNTFLDRGTVVGTFENPEIGLFYNQLYCGQSWEKNIVSNSEDDKNTDKKQVEFVEKSEDENNPKIHINILDKGIDLKGESLKEFLKDIASFSDNKKEVANIKKMSDKVKDSINAEELYQDVMFSVENDDEEYYCDLFWMKNKVAFFTGDNKDGYEAAKNSEWNCYISDSDDFDVEKLINDLEVE